MLLYIHSNKESLMHFKAAQFSYSPETKCYAAEASELRIGQPGQYVYIDGYAFMFTHADKDATGEDTYGWNYKPTMNAISLNGALHGHRVLIIND